MTLGLLTASHSPPAGRTLHAHKTTPQKSSSSTPNTAPEKKQYARGELQAQ
ncbi:hypothetical protein QJS04_geneDACA015212 [Acorus gramineus]|uniref:Uncharacterized protein n=1 Tax=Acorus gramineus TaxID=55184 RepID=A0AAV9BE13_ACOGR|nr:hypothetical protein QJS04_geneDACA015212 [Acorus gramineus]